MSSTALLITDIKNKLVISICIIFIIFGTVGNLFNIILFTKRRLRTLSPCVRYLLACSIANMFNIYTFIILYQFAGFKISPVNYSPAYCKLQIYFYYTSVGLSSWFMAGCCADRFFSSSRNAVIRRYSSMRMTNRILFIVTMMICLGYLQVLYCYDSNQIGKPSGCYVQNDICYVIDVIYYFVFQSIGPPVLMLVFGIGTILHIHQGRQVRPQMENEIELGERTVPSSINARNTGRRVNKNILPMLTIQVTVYILCITPLLATKIYQNIPLSIVKSDVRISAENIFLNMSILISLVDKIFSFYIYTLSSAYYREEFIKLFNPCRPRQRIATQN